MQKLKAAVIGLGEMGQHHARVYAQMDTVGLVAVCDVDSRKLANITRTWGGKPYTSHWQMLRTEQPDLVSVAVPTVAHFKIVSDCLWAGAHVLVEKPITDTIKAAQLLINLAKQQKQILAVGHIERCNPIVAAVKRHIDEGDLGRIYRIGTRRVGPSPERIRDVGCTIDLLTHDLDIARFLLQSEPLAYHAELLHANHGDYDDAVTAIVRFENDIIGSFEADWLSSAKDRVLVITGEQGVLTADYMAQQGVLEFSPSERVQITVPRCEPLRTELEAFAAAARGEGRPAATGQDGLAALRMALQILEAGNGI